MSIPTYHYSLATARLHELERIDPAGVTVEVPARPRRGIRVRLGVGLVRAGTRLAGPERPRIRLAHQV